jgi:hypothetical protein
MAIENITKYTPASRPHTRYGILVNPIAWVTPFFTDPHGVPVLLVWLFLATTILAGLALEKVSLLLPSLCPTRLITACCC